MLLFKMTVSKFVLLKTHFYSDFYFKLHLQSNITHEAL
jgi:hypothetical protein